MRYFTLFVLMSVFLFSASAQTAEELYAEELTEEIAAAISGNDPDEALALISAYRRLGIKVPPILDIAEGDAHLLQDELPKALAAYNSALSSTGLSSLERVQTEEKIRQITPIIEERNKITVAQKRRSEQQLSMLADEYDQFLSEATLFDIVDFLGGADADAKELFWNLQFDRQRVDTSKHEVHREGLIYARNSIYSTRSETLSEVARTARLQNTVMCSSDVAAQQKFFELMFSDVRGRPTDWMILPAMLPRGCWEGWERLLDYLDFDAENWSLTLGENERLPSRWGLGIYNGVLDLAALPSSFMFSEFLGRNDALKSNAEIKYDIAFQVPASLPAWGGNRPGTREFNHADAIRGGAVALHFVANGHLIPTSLVNVRPDATNKPENEIYTETIDEYSAVITVYSEHFDGHVADLKYGPCNLNAISQLDNLLFWRAVQLSGERVFDNISNGCTFSRKERGVEYVNDNFKMAVRTVPSPSILGPSREFSGENSPLLNAMIVDFLIYEQVNWDYTWTYSRDLEFPLLKAAETGQCVLFRRLRDDLGAKDYRRRARKTIRSLDSTCR